MSEPGIVREAEQRRNTGYLTSIPVLCSMAVEVDDMDSRLDAIARMLEALDRKGDAEVKLSPDARRLLTQATILLRREADASQAVR